MTPRTWLLAAGALTALAITAYHVDAAWDTRTAAVGSRNDAQRDLAAGRRARGVAEKRLGEAKRISTEVRAARDGAYLTVTQRNAELAAVEAEADTARGVLNTVSTEADIVRQCLDGAGKALDALQRDDPTATVAALQAVDAACRAAQAGRVGPSPQYGFDFPDPAVLAVGEDLYAFATNATAGNIQVLRHQGNGGWTTVGDALGALPTWSVPGSTWAPAVIARPGGFVMYYTAREAFTGRQCISIAVSSNPAGPYLDGTPAPLECGETGAIDPEPVVGPTGDLALLWKHERPATIMARGLAPNGLTFAGTAKELLRATRPWEGGNVEAPSMLVIPGGAWLFYSANDWNGSKYATGVVRCSSIMGPCDRTAAAPLFSSHDALRGPGGGAVFQESPGQFRFAFHGYQMPNVGYPASRLFFIASIDLASGRPVLVE